MTEPRDRDDELNRFWNALAAGEPAAEPRALDPGDVELLRRVQAVGTAPVGGRSAQQMWPAVLARIATPAEHVPAASASRGNGVETASANGHDHRAGPPQPPSPAFGPVRLTPPLPLSRERGQGGEGAPRDVKRVPTSHLGHMATAALIVLTLTASLFLFGPLGRAPRAFLTHLPAIGDVLPVAGDVTTETLFDESAIPLPAGHADIEFGYHRLQPGVSGHWRGRTGAVLLEIEQGTVEVTSAGEVRVLTAGERNAGPIFGDLALRNIGEDEARVIEISVVDATQTFNGASGRDWYSDPRGGALDRPISVATILPGGSGRITLERLTVPPGVALAPFAALPMEWTGVGVGRLSVTLRGDRLPFRWDFGEERTFGNFAQLPAIAAGTEVTLRNAADDPLVLYRLTITPEPVGTPSPDPSQEITTETLLDEAIAALPPSHAQLLVNVAQMQPEVSAGYSGQVGTFLYAVERGTAELALATGKKILTAGDRIEVPVDGSISMRNVGADEAHFIEVQVLDAVATNSGPGSPTSALSDPLRVTTQWPIEIATTLSGGPGRVTLTRLTLPPGAVLPAFIATGLDWTGVVAGRVGVVPRGDRLPFRWHPGEERTYGQGGQIPAFVAGSEVTLRNASDDPLVLYRLIITPTE